LPKGGRSVNLEEVVPIGLFLVFSLAGLLRAETAKLTIVQPAIHDYEDSPAVTSSFRFNPGDRVYLSFLIAGFQVTPGEEEKRIKLTYTIQAQDERGVPLETPSAGKVDTALAAEDKEWMPKIRHVFSVPPLADPGSYRIRISVKDELAGTEAHSEARFSVRGRVVEPSETLTIRNFRFLRTEEDADRGLEPAAYRPGDPVYARFEITGYKLADKNRFSVEYGIEVLKPDGERIFAEPTAASEQQESFYPKRYIEGAVQLGFKPALPAGEYTVVIPVRDLTGSQTYEGRYVFRVE
jgi:hypothetical protein